MSFSTSSDHSLPSESGIATPEQIRARRRIEAMRLGVVPDVRDGVSSPSHPALICAARSTLELTGRGRGGLQAFVGEYGVGKTHLLERIRAEALQRGFITARAVLDPKECAPSHPKRVYRRIITDLTYPDRPGRGLRPLLERALRSARAHQQFLVDEAIEPRDALDSGAHLYLTPALRYLDSLGGAPLEAGDARGEAADMMLRWLEGDPTIANREISGTLRRVAGSHGKLYSLKDYRPWSRIYGYLLSGVARLARLSGYGGLAVFVDEAEFHALLSGQNRSFALELFRALAWAAKAGNDLPFERAALDGGGLGVLRDLPPSYDAHSNLYVAMAFTPAGECRETLRRFVPSKWCREIPRLDARELARLAESLVDDYRIARPRTEVSGSSRTDLADLVLRLVELGFLQSPRDVARFVIELLDLARVGKMSDEIARLNDRYSTDSWGWG